MNDREEMRLLVKNMVSVISGANIRGKTGKRDEETSNRVEKLPLPATTEKKLNAQKNQRDFFISRRGYVRGRAGGAGKRNINLEAKAIKTEKIVS